MPGKRDIEAGRAILRLGLKNDLTGKLTKALAGVGKSLRQTGAQISGVGIKITAVGAGMAAPFIASIKAASDLQETMSKFDTVFGDRSAEAKKWGDDFAAVVGRSQVQIAQFLASSQDLFVPLGFEPGAAEEMSKQITKLAVDLASFNNMTDADAMRDLQAALTGSGEVMKKYGVIVSEAAVKQELLNQGLDPKVATDQQKVMARLNIIMKGTTAAQGDAERTAGSFANQMKALQGVVTDVSGEVGSALLPIVTDLVSRVKAVALQVKDFISQNKGLIVAAAGVAAAVIGVGVALTIAGGAITAVGFAATALSAILGAILSPIGLIATALATGVVLWFRYTDAGQKTLGVLRDSLGEIWKTAQQTFGGIGDALKSGDIQLAGKIAFTGLQLAALQALDAIKKLFGDTTAAIAGDLLSGNFSGAWETATMQMGVLWDSLMANVLKSMADMARGVQGIWFSIVKSTGEAFLAMQVTLGRMTKQQAEFGRMALGISVGLARERSASINSPLTSVADSLDAAASASAKRRDRRQKELTARVAAKAGEIGSEEARLKGILDKLTGEAAAKAAAAGVSGGGTSATGAAAPGASGLGGGIGGAIPVTFNAAAAIAGGFQAQKPPAEKKLDDISTNTKRTAEATERNAEEMAAFVRALRFG